MKKTHISSMKKTSISNANNLRDQQRLKQSSKRRRLERRVQTLSDAWRWMSLIVSVSESASRCSSVSMGWHRTTCLLCATLHPDSLDARTFALRIADSSTFHALHCRRAVFEPLRMLVHLCGTLCPFISRTTIWLLQLSCAILSLIYFLSTYFVLSAFGVWSHKCAI